MSKIPQGDSIIISIGLPVAHLVDTANNHKKQNQLSLS